MLQPNYWTVSLIYESSCCYIDRDTPKEWRSSLPTKFRRNSLDLLPLIGLAPNCKIQNPFPANKYVPRIPTHAWNVKIRISKNQIWREQQK